MSAHLVAMNKYYFTGLFFLSILLSSVLNAQTVTAVQASVEVTGQVVSPLDLNLNDLKKFNQTDIVRKDKAGNDHTYKGVMLSDILQKAGVTLGKELRGKNLSKYILVEASDGYEVVFALPELDNNFTEKKVILAYQEDGKPLPVNDGPFHVIIQDEKIPARCVRMVTAIKVEAAL